VSSTSKSDASNIGASANSKNASNPSSTNAPPSPKNDLKTLRQERRISPDLAFRDPYILDFLGLTDTYSEYDLESAILADLQRFITELGSDFAFLSRQKRITIDQRDYYIDLLFYHRRLNSPENG
jgi:predicted nuclease of restriction endonuclease-like (RecB) superfamily